MLASADITSVLAGISALNTKAQLKRLGLARTMTPVRLDPLTTGAEASELERGLRKLVVGQDESIRQIVSVYQSYLAGMNSPGRPIGSFLFLGPSGTGKTRVIEATAETLLHDPLAVVKVDCAEFQHSHEIAKLVGSPPGYLGHRETHAALSQEALDAHHTVQAPISLVLFDEIEKGSDALWHLLLGILDKGILTLGDNRKVDFSQCLIFMTSNLGASEMEALASPGVGFSAASGVVDSEALRSSIQRIGSQAARKRFSPEFINRIDKTVVFHSLGENELRQVLRLELRRIQRLVLSGTPFLFELTDSAQNLVLEKGADPKYGARHLKRSLDRLFVHPMANLVASAQIRSGDRIDVDRDAQGLIFQRIDEDLSHYQICRAAGLDLPVDEPSRGGEASKGISRRTEQSAREFLAR